MKLSFSLTSKSSSRPNIKPSQNFGKGESAEHRETTHEYVTEFDASKTLTEGKQQKLIIPPKPNEWRPHKKMKNLDLPLQSSSQSTDLSFEPEDPSLASKDADSSMSYGLNLRQTAKQEGGLSDGDTIRDPPRSAPADTMLQKLKDDLKRLPEDRGFDEFADVPVEGFGAALLAGYGWYEGRGIGKNAKEDVKVVEYKRRTAKEGLGFVSAHHKKSRIPDSISVGKEVRIVGGRDVGLKGKIIEILDADSSTPLVVLKLSRSGELVTVHIHEVADLGSAEEEKCLKKLRDLKIRARDEKIDSSGTLRYKEEKRKEMKRGGEDKKGYVELKHENDVSSQYSSRREEQRKPLVSWLTSHIRVRIISKDFKGGRLYLKKGEIVDVIDPTTCDISMDDSRELIQGIGQELLETAIPRRGGPVLVLYGKHKGAYGNLVERNTEKETGVVRDADTHELIKVRLEEVAEYVGDPTSIGY